jgi:hypothetical protein
MAGHPIRHDGTRPDALVRAMLVPAQAIGHPWQTREISR